ncbi:Gfo/Idh/MocA family oxidoreductase [Arenibacter sp. 6A1]|uniref:Gfo/Idh/MocA family protein n=1 Tax=Arenibacter sp. 6A1 TaxID=2720391 RepID=UPI001445030E|nr:Gfo/Idh/MocA family oxidoreductase [Arenibacter sp. 6A1]NKI26176.1 Gfo/Idh/MocA family oxidoreductase [Arenibacter sp. 6A1]
MEKLKNQKTIRWGIIGCGAVTEIKSGPAYQQTDNFELVAVMRRDAEKAKDYAHRHGVPKYYTKAEDLIDDPEVDAVYIATPPDTHKYYALKVAQAGKPCCVEKPMAPSYADSLAIYNAFEEKSLPLFVAYYRRSLPRFVKIKEWISQGGIGEPRHVRWHLSKPANQLDLSKKYNWRTDSKIAPGGYFDDLASHGLDLFTWLLGDIEKASGISVNQQGLYSAKDAVSACWLHKNGVTGEGSWNFGAAERQDKVEIIGSKGKILFSVFQEDAQEMQNAQGTTRVFVENPKHIQKYHAKNIRDHLVEGKAHPSHGSSALHSSWVMDQILGL